MSRHIKSAKDRAAEVIQKYLDWKTRNPITDAKAQREIMRGLVRDAIEGAENALHVRLSEGRKAAFRLRQKKHSPRPSFPFHTHRTLAEVGAEKEPA